MNEENDIIRLKEEYLQHPKLPKFKKELIKPGYSFKNLEVTLREAVSQAKGALDDDSSFLNGYRENYFQEIFQNANDAIRKAKNGDKTCRMYFSEKDGLYTVICSYKEKGFTLADLFSLIKNNSSGKSKEDGQTGTFGIGIKSLWVFADYFSITSNIKVGFSYNNQTSGDPLSVFLNYAEDWDKKTTQLTFSFRRNNGSDRINTNKLCDFIDLLTGGDLTSAEKYLIFNGWENTLFDLRMLLFTSEKGGMDKLELYRSDETAPLLTVSCSSTALNEVSVKTISIKRGNESGSSEQYTLTRHSSPEHIVALKVPEKLTIEALTGLYCKEPVYFADFFVSAECSSDLLVSCNSTDHSRSTMKTKPLIQYQGIIAALINAAACAKQDAELREADRFACTRALCGIAMSREKWLPVPQEGQEDNSDLDFTGLNGIYVGMAGGKAIDVIYNYNSSPLDLKASSINDAVLECFGKLVASHLPSGTNSPVFYLPEKTRSGFLKDSKAADSFPADSSDSASAEELSRFLDRMNVEVLQADPILSEFPAAYTLSGAVSLLEINKITDNQNYSAQIYNAIRGRAGETGFDIEGMPTKAAVIDKLISDSPEDEFMEQYGELYQAAQKALCTVDGIRRKWNSYFGYYFRHCYFNVNQADNCALGKDSLLKLASLLSFPEVQERLAKVQGCGVALAESAAGKNIQPSNGLFSPPYLNKNPKNENNNNAAVKMIDLNRLLCHVGSVSMSFADFQTLWERLFSLAEGCSKRTHCCYYNGDLIDMPYSVIGYFKSITYRISDISLTEYIDWLCRSADKLHDIKMSEERVIEILNNIKAEVNGSANAESSFEYQDMTEFISRHLLAQTNIKEVVILDAATHKTISGSCGKGILELQFSGNKTLKNSVKVVGEAEEGRLYIFTGSSRSNADLHGKIINALPDTNCSSSSDNKNDDPRNFLKYFIHTGREYNVKSADFDILISGSSTGDIKRLYEYYRGKYNINSADFDILISGSSMGFGYLYRRLREDSYLFRIPSRENILPVMVRTILCGRNSYDRHCPFCNGSFVSSIDGGSSDKELVTVTIPLHSENDEKTFLPVIMCKDCYKRFIHVTSAKLEGSELTLEVSVSDNCRQARYDVTVPLSPDNMEIYRKFNKLQNPTAL